MRYLVALALTWVVPATTLTWLCLAPGLAVGAIEVVYVVLVVSVPLALLITFIVLPVMALVDASTAYDRRRRARAGRRTVAG